MKSNLIFAIVRLLISLKKLLNACVSYVRFSFKPLTLDELILKAEGLARLRLDKGVASFEKATDGALLDLEPQLRDQAILVCNSLRRQATLLSEIEYRLNHVLTPGLKQATETVMRLERAAEISGSEPNAHSFLSLPLSDARAELSRLEAQVNQTTEDVIILKGKIAQGWEKIGRFKALQNACRDAYQRILVLSA